MDKLKHEKNKAELVKIKQKSNDMQKLADAFKKLPKGQLKKVLTTDIIEIFKENGVDI